MGKALAAGWFVGWVTFAACSVGTEMKSGTYGASTPFNIAIFVGTSMFLGWLAAKEGK